ncbi:MAG: GCN5-related N-acetyltransferase [Labilithrix sp.]|nr:GCN5-related N-acetyltransferase [Labilithrix sp.]
MVRVLIRQLEEGDWPAVLAIFREVVEAGDTFAYDPGWADHVAREVWGEAPPGCTVVAVEGDRLLGTGKMGRNRPGPGAHVATASYMVAGDARGRGVGRALAEHSIAWAKAQGYAAMQFNAVVASNTVAVELYRRLGFVVIGTVPEAFAHAQLGRVGLHVMHRFL